jgi:hypothetical protein
MNKYVFRQFQFVVSIQSEVSAVFNETFSSLVGIWKLLSQGHCIAALVQVSHHHKFVLFELSHGHVVIKVDEE